MTVTPEDIRKKMSKIVEVAKSVSGLAEMVQKQGEKAAKLSADNAGSFDAESYKVFLKAIEAVDVGKNALFKEIKALMETCTSLQDTLDKAEKEGKPKKKK
jgi:predicted  nucleic acid-binding Zn-ribbon protein